MRNNKIRLMGINSIIAVIYAVLTVVLAPISYGGIQFRVAEIMLLLVIYNPSYCFGLTVGCFFANCFSSLGIYDCVFGTLATLISVLIMSKIKNKYIASIIPVIANAIIIGLELYFILDLPFIISALEVALGEFVCVTIVGCLVFSGIERNEGLMELLELNKTDKKE